ncbi:head-tail connector protein [Paraburkholderia dipogonis]|uniref:head-tail connector protein n=1 Tax=Paraburkholderia dipogonis TaxID=1211383 RepID=UPI0038B90AEE
MNRPAIRHLAVDEPVSLELAKQHCRVDGAQDDGLFKSVYIPAARQSAEEYTGLIILAQPTLAWVASGLCTPHSIPLPHTPVSDVAGVTALDRLGTRTVLDPDTYGMSIAYRKMRAVLMSEAELPVATEFEVAYTAGFADATCPPNLLLAMLLLVGDAYENREAQQSGTSIQSNPRAVALLDPFRISFGV